MSRWWADAEQSRQMLGLVDGSDVVQGVGTAILAYHGLSAAALAPLASRTLVDVAQVGKALDSVDLEPVAKALREATRPVLGDAAEFYGRLLAEDVHRQAADSTERLLLSLTSSGMPWPVALERAAEVHGIPAERLGQVASKFRAPAIPPLVRADIADRELMDYAAHVGKREAAEVTGVSKANASQFDPNEHPRGARGRFVDAPNRREPDAARMERQARRERRLRQIQRKTQRAENARRMMAEQAPQADQRSLADVVMGLFRREEDTSSPVADLDAKRNARREARKKEQRAARRGGQVQATEAQAGRPAATPGAQKGEHRVEGERLAFVPREVANQIIAGKLTSMAQITQAAKARQGDSVLWMTPETVEREISHLGRDGQHYLLDMVLLDLDGNIPTSGGRRDESFTVADGAKIRMLDPQADEMDAFDINPDYAVEIKGNAKHPNPAWRQDRSVPIPILHLRVDNWQDWDLGPDDGPPLPHDKTSKAYEFREADVRRDARGRFADEPNRLEPDNGFAARQQRRQRSKRRGKLVARREAVAARAAEQQAAMERHPAMAAAIRQAIESDPLAQEDTVADLSSRRSARRFSEIRRTKRKEALRAARKIRDKQLGDAKPGMNLANQQFAILTDDQFMALEGLGSERDTHERVRQHMVLESVTPIAGRKGLSDMRTQAYKEMKNKIVTVPSDGEDGFALFSSAEEAEEEAQAYMGAISLLAEEEGHENPTNAWHRTTSLNNVLWGPEHIENSRPFAQMVMDKDTKERFYRARILRTATGLNTRTIIAGGPEDTWEKISQGVIPELRDAGQVSFRETLIASGYSREQALAVPDFMVQVYEPVFGQNDDED